MNKGLIRPSRPFRLASFYRGLKPKCPSSFTARTFFTTPVTNLKIESTKAHKKILKPEVCSGCGSKFQKDSPKLPGYLPDEAMTPPEIKKGKLPNSYLSNLDVMKLISGIDIDVQRKMFKENSTTLSETDHLPDLFNSSLTEKTRASALVCQRCYTLQHHEKMSTDWKENSKIDISFLRFLQEQPRSVIIYVVDAFDLSGSLIKGIQENLIGMNKNRRMVLVLNKKDLLPKGITPSFLNRFIREKLYEVGLLDSVLKHFLVSAKSREGLSQLVEYLQELGQGESDFYFVGCTNVGKSELINALVNMATERGHDDRARLKITTSVVPGTTMDLVKIPLQKLSKLFQQNTSVFEQPNFSVFDTPGIFNPTQLTHYLTHEELKMALPSKPFKPKTYRWEPGRALFLGGLARFDYLKGTKRIYVTIYSSLPVHMTNIPKAEELTKDLNDNTPTLLYPPIPSDNRVSTIAMPELKPIATNPLQFTPPTIFKRVASDVCVAGVGWISLIVAFDEPEPVELKAYSRGGHGVTCRKPILPVLDDFTIQSRVPNIPPLKPTK